MNYKRQKLNKELSKIKYTNRVVVRWIKLRFRDLEHVNDYYLDNVIKDMYESYLKLNTQYKTYKTSLKNTYYLEVHRYAPELNKLHLRDGKIISVPQKTNIKDACKFYSLTK